MSTTAFQNDDQKANQLFQLLSAVLKAAAETRGHGSASRTGL